MKKSKLAIGLMSALLSVGALAACSDVTYSKDGVILTYTGEDGKTVKYTAEDLFNDEFRESNNYQTVFDAVYKLVIKNYFNENDPDDDQYGKKQLDSLKNKAETAVEGDKDSAKKKAEANGTSYDTEFNSILKEKGCEDESELYEHYLYQYEEEKFNDNFEKIPENMKIMKNGTVAASDPTKYEGNEWNGYFKDKVPYHLSHILVKITDSDSTNYSNAKLSEENAKKLARVAKLLKEGNYGSFGDIAAKESDDGAVRGDLGLVDMDKTAQYINEFKYAVYAYENLYGKKAEAGASKIKFPSADVKADYETYSHLEEDEHAQGFAEIPYAAFQILESNAERTTGALDQKVHDGNEDFFPRNVFFNHFFNRHSFALVTPKGAEETIAASGYLDKVGDALIAGTDYVELTETSKNSTGFHAFTAEDGVGFTGEYLAARVKIGDKVYFRPILVVRGGSGSGESGYQGIHFIIVNRSPFEDVAGDETKHLASLDTYYTTFFPKESSYPRYAVGEENEPYQTYVTFSGNEDDYKTRAEEVKSAVKSYDSDGLKYFMFKKYLKAGKLEFKDENMKNGLVKWMNNSVQNKSYNSEVEWENNWIKYVENLKQSQKLQKKAISKTCAIYYAKQDETPAEASSGLYSGADAWNKVGGYCNDGQKHN